MVLSISSRIVVVVAAPPPVQPVLGKTSQIANEQQVHPHHLGLCIVVLDRIFALWDHGVVEQGGGQASMMVGLFVVAAPLPVRSVLGKQTSKVADETCLTHHLCLVDLDRDCSSGPNMEEEYASMVGLFVVTATPSVQCSGQTSKVADETSLPH